MKEMTCADFRDGQEAREALVANGWRPLCDIGGAEHWVRGGRRIILHQDDTGNLERIIYAEFIRLDSGEILVQPV